MILKMAVLDLVVLGTLIRWAVDLKGVDNSGPCLTHYRRNARLYSSLNPIWGSCYLS